MKKIVTIVGARPQFIKVAPVSAALKATSKFHEILVHTGQHFDADMSDVFFEELGIDPPEHNLAIHGGGHGEMTGAMLQKIEPLLLQVKPECVLVYGDTNSTLAGALAAAKLHIPVAHVEAGLRSFNKKMPEELNRILTDHMARYLFASTESARENLLREGADPSTIYFVGDVMFDASLHFADVARSRSSVMERLALKEKEFVLATVHRAENTDDSIRLLNIVDGLETVAASMQVVLPLHPRTRQKLAQIGFSFKNVMAIDPVGYLDMISLEANATLIATDSGGVQKEAFFFKVPCVTLRDETEWVELVASGWNTLLSPSLPDLASQILDKIGRVGADIEPYGQGNAAAHIAEVLLQ
ncbi:non-hydrolyzing UDP-N-acetylglucosamine 2-epimerase [Gellertiella hungarica]|uniref:UDP-GlcNAc3NAcA epimerase n=1 Tax=Gellertiella hungarica TaxID=1572859 RepID=A0A7W6J3R8_9HYPH|nr:UDP-N-acetylglucosamine 2-epimerase (non-hydrolyzing) [Gellertiella hungarica]MBB4064213.1 UDP-GlcNAc3NAcA epimerase [Gellertiella hungarica]